MSQCKAHRTNGQPCKGQAISGATVCRVHGGSAPQVLAAAKIRLLEMVDPALATLARGVKQRKGTPTAQEIAAAKDILDRAGLKPVEKHEHTVWDGDPANLSDEQLATITEYFWAMVDPVRREELRRKVLLTEGPVIDVEAVVVQDEQVSEKSVQLPEDDESEEDW